MLRQLEHGSNRFLENLPYVPLLQNKNMRLDIVDASSISTDLASKQNVSTWFG